MNMESTRIIGDILEINSDIINQRLESKSPKIITKIKEHHYRKRLDKSIKNIKTKVKYLDKFNLQELLYYLYTYHESTYPFIQNIQASNMYDNNIITAEFYIEPLDRKDIHDIKYVVSVSTKNPEITISFVIHYQNGTIKTTTIRKESLYIDKISDDDTYILSILNNNLLNIMEDFLLKYLERFKENKGYMKEV